VMRFAGCDNLAAAISTSRSKTRSSIHPDGDIAGLGVGGRDSVVRSGVDQLACMAWHVVQSRFSDLRSRCR